MEKVTCEEMIDRINCKRQVLGGQTIEKDSHYEIELIADIVDAFNDSVGDDADDR